MLNDRDGVGQFADNEVKKVPDTRLPQRRLAAIRILKDTSPIEVD